ncbi:hypothetical protein niasHT_008806 [Heterodera trifolii]|uniref:Uncharacterized protein n=1 Tax=Heterodera trifolii TaxID=157864 RepID=A0ABD2LSP0_9BILA
MDFDYSAYYNALVFDFKKHYGQMFDPSQTSHQRPFNKEAVSDFFFEGNGAKNGTTCNAADVTQLHHHLPKDSERQLRGQSLDYQFCCNRPVEDASSDDDDADDNAAQQNIVQRQGPDIDARAVQRPIVRVPPGFRQAPVRPFPPLLLPRQGPQVPHRVFPVPHPHVQHPFLHVRPLPMPRQGPPMPYNALHAPQHPIRFPIVNVPPLALPPRGKQCLFNITIIQSTAYRFRCPSGATNVASCCACSTSPSSNQRPTASAALPGASNGVMLCLFNTPSSNQRLTVSAAPSGATNVASCCACSTSPSCNQRPTTSAAPSGSSCAAPTMAFPTCHRSRPARRTKEQSSSSSELSKHPKSSS